MIQTHLMKLEPPYPVLNMKGTFGRHVATLIEVRTMIDPHTGDEKIKTISHPVVDYGDNNYSGVVYEEINLEECDILPKLLPMLEFHSIVHGAQSMFNNKLYSLRPEVIVAQLKALGVTVNFPKEKDAEGFDTNEPAKVIEVNISLGYSERNQYWWAESDIFSFCFDARDMKSDKELLNYIREMRSGYYAAFSEYQFDIVFHNNREEAQYLIDELNRNPHL